MNHEKNKYSPLPAVDEEDESTPLSSDAAERGMLMEEEQRFGAGAGITSCFRRNSPNSSSRSGNDSERSSSLVYCACIATLVCSVLNLIFLFSPRLPFAVSTNTKGTDIRRITVTHQTNPSLDRPSVYIGLDKLPSNISRAALPPLLVVYPPLFQPVDHVNRYRVFPEDEHARLTFNGKISPGDRHVLLSEHVTMIAQYRVHDFGVENCRITASIPDERILAQKNQIYHIEGDTSVIEVWNVTTPTIQTLSGGPSRQVELDSRMLTWDSKPPRDRLMARLPVERNKTTYSETFWCGPSGSLQTFELLCRGKGCYIDLWQDYYFKPRYGIYVTQHPSV